MFRKYSASSFFALLGITTLILLIITFFLQHTALKAAVLAFKYDLLPFFIFGIGICLGYCYFTEKDSDLLSFYHKIIKRAIRLGFLWWFILYICPHFFKIFGFGTLNYEGTIGMAPPAAYYTNIYPEYQNSYVRNSFLFERPTTFGFWLIGFFPFFVLCFLRNQPKKKQIIFSLLIGLLVFSTWSRAALVIR